VNPNTIYFQSKGFPEFRFLSNFHICEFKDLKYTYQSVEHYYQSQKCSDPVEALDIINSSHPAVARRMGQKVARVGNWDDCRIHVMRNGCRMKFDQNKDLSEMLLATYPFELIEYAPWGDVFWGVDRNYNGANNLGIILMEIRTNLIKGLT